MVMPKEPVKKPRTAGPKTNMGPENIPTKPQGGGFVNTPTKPKGTKPQGGGFVNTPTKPKGIKPVKPVKPVRGGSRPKGIEQVGRPPKGIKPILLGVGMPVNSGPKKTMMATGGMAGVTGITPVGMPTKPKGIKPKGVGMPIKPIKSVKPVNSGPKKTVSPKSGTPGNPALYKVPDYRPDIDVMGPALLKTMMAKGGMAKKGKK